MNTISIQQLDKLRSELDRPALKNLEGKKNIIGVEIGVQYGINARDILEKYDIKTLYLIDPYVPYPSASGEGMARVEGWKIVEEYLDKFRDKIVGIRKHSWDAANDIPNELDFVYIDGDHRYEAVKKDLELYYPKVKVGGLFSGHDYAPRAPAVMKAVDEFFENKKEKVYSGGRWDWFVFKE